MKFTRSLFLLFLLAFNYPSEASNHPTRYAFPALCKSHYDNTINTIDTWMEPADKDFINSTKKFLWYIPKPYHAFCSSCFKCGGFAIAKLNDEEWPSNSKIYNEIEDHHYQIKPNGIEFCNLLVTTEDYCEDLCWDGGYFRKWNHKYSNFFLHFLQYSSENEECDCFWPEWSKAACSINNVVYNHLRGLCDAGLITPQFSEYWIAKKNEFIPKFCSDYASMKKHNHTPCSCMDYYSSTNSNAKYEKNYFPNSHGMASSLVTYTFFYSQYHQLLLDVIEFIQRYGHAEPIEIDRIYKLLEEIRNEFDYLYDDCLDAHPNPKIYYEIGLLCFHSGKFEDALLYIEALMEAVEDDDSIILSSEIYQQEGALYAELGNYDLAIKALNKAIQLNPNNKQSYFDRAFSYFEKGNFSQALEDYLKSKSNESIQQIPLLVSNEFLGSLLNGIKTGGIEAASEFLPSLLHSLQGINRCLWSIVQQPIATTHQFANCCYDTATASYEYLKGIDSTKLEGYCDEFKKLCTNFNDLSDSEKGQLIGYCTGKYGVEIFGTGAILKGVTAAKKLRDTNRALNFETMLTSKTNKDILIASSVQHAKEREAFFKKIHLHVDRQNKHVIGAHNYESGKSILTHADPQGLLNKFAGKGAPVKDRVPGMADYREKINFGEFIGYHVNQNTGIQTKTSYGEIRYSKTGAHIIPIFPQD